ncbi:MAG: hypothetical protein H0T51_11815 [Pirellulales bacterium]|nr:hypothetical protein [Pirellulales bacterium]
MVFKLMQSAEKRWRAFNGSDILPDVIQGTAFIDGIQYLSNADCTTDLHRAFLPENVTTADEGIV